MTTLMNKNIRLNQKATIQVLDDLMRARFIKRTVLKDRPLGLKSMHTTWTKDGTDMIASYTEAFRAIRKPTKRNIDAFNNILTTRAIHYMRERGLAE